MKKIATLIMMVAFCGIAFAGENLVKNGDFSQEGKNSIAAGWRKGWPKIQGTLTLDKEVKKSATCSLKATNTAKDQYTFYRQKFAVTPNTEYVFSCWMKGKDIVADEKAGAQYWILKNGGKTFRAGSYIGLWKTATGTFDWNKIMIAFKTKAETEFTIMLGLTKNSTGTAWFDDVKLMKK